MQENNKILVAGSTGTQGGAVVDHLLSGEYGDYDVYGLTRNADSDAAQSLSERGVTVVEGDTTDADRMRTVCEGMDGVFSVTAFMESGTDVEVEQGVTLAEAAADVGVDHYVYSSVGGAERDTGLPHFESKYEVERRIEELDLTSTVVRPTFFMQNFGAMMADPITDGELPMPLGEGVSLQVVDADDIGMTVAAAFSAPERFAGERIELAGDELTIEEFAETLTAALEWDVEPVRVPIEDYRAQAGDEMADMFTWFNEYGYEADIESIRSDYDLPVNSFEAYLTTADVDAVFGVRPTAEQ